MILILDRWWLGKSGKDIPDRADHDLAELKGLLPNLFVAIEDYFNPASTLTELKDWQEERAAEREAAPAPDLQARRGG